MSENPTLPCGCASTRGGSRGPVWCPSPTAAGQLLPPPRETPASEVPPRASPLLARAHRDHCPQASHLPSASAAWEGGRSQAWGREPRAWEGRVRRMKAKAGELPPLSVPTAHPGAPVASSVSVRKHSRPSAFTGPVGRHLRVRCICDPSSPPGPVLTHSFLLAQLGGRGVTPLRGTRQHLPLVPALTPSVCPRVCAPQNVCCSRLPGRQ